MGVDRRKEARRRRLGIPIAAVRNSFRLRGMAS
jgi:hypothetical protein